MLIIRSFTPTPEHIHVAGLRGRLEEGDPFNTCIGHSEDLIVLTKSKCFHVEIINKGGLKYLFTLLSLYSTLYSAVWTGNISKNCRSVGLII